jgi:hypothetical protein
MYTDLIKGKITYSLDFPKTIVPSPQTLDYENGFIERYFTQRANDSSSFVFEINLQQFIELSTNPYWSVGRMRWRLTGPIDSVYSSNGLLVDVGVRSSNLASISIISENIKNIDLYLINPLQFHK